MRSMADEGGNGAAGFKRHDNARPVLSDQQRLWVRESAERLKSQHLKTQQLKNAALSGHARQQPVSGSSNAK